MDALKPSFITDELEQAFKEYAVEQFPKEACAYIKDGELITVKNTHKDPENYFSLTKKDTLACLKAQGFLHSHPNGKPVPSSADLASSIAFGIPFGLVSANETGCSQVIWWGDHVLDVPVEGRQFIDNIMDCWELVRAVYWQDRGIKLPNVVRDATWWKDGEDLYETLPPKCGFVEVDDLQPYDMIVMRIGSRVANHAAVYLGDGKIIQHFQFKTSSYDNLGRYGKLVHKVYRYIG